MHHEYLNKPISKEMISVQNESNVYFDLINVRILM